MEYFIYLIISWVIVGVGTAIIQFIDAIHSGDDITIGSIGTCFILIIAGYYSAYVVLNDRFGFNISRIILRKGK